MPLWKRHWAVIVLILLPLVVLWKCIFLGETIGPWDQVMQMAPWNAPKATAAWDVLQADGVLQFYPWRDLVFRSWSGGEPPFWNPYQLCGTPILANSQSAGLYPLHILFGVLHLPTSLAITLLAWFHLAWASLGARFLAKQFGANEFGAVLAGVAFGLSAFMVSWTPLPSVITTCAWIPWVIALGYKLISQPEKDMILKNTIALALCTGMMFLGGHLQFTAYGLMGLFVVVTSKAIRGESTARNTIALVAALVCGGLLAAPQILPVLDFSKTSHRQTKPTPEGAAGYVASALGAADLAGIVVPSVTGLPGMAVDGRASYWPADIKRGAAFSEGAIGVGSFAFLLLFLFKKPDLKQKVPLIALTVTGFLLVTGSLSLILYNFLPGWSSTGSPGRASVLVVLGLTTMAGTLFPEKLDPKAIKAPLIGLACGLAITFLLCNTAQGAAAPQIASSVNLLIRSGISFSILAFPLGFLAFFCYLRKQPALVLTIGIAATLLSGSIFCLPSGQNRIAQSDNTQARRAYINSDWALSVAANAIMPGNTATIAQSHDVAGYDSLINKDSLEVLRAINSGEDPAPPANGNMMFIKRNFDPVKLADAGVTEVWTTKPLPQLLTSPTLKDGYAIFELPGPGRAYVMRADGKTEAAKFVHDGTASQVIEASGPGKLIVKDRNMPGWIVSVDGSTAKLEGDTWREVDLPSGNHKVEFHYTPPGFQTGLGLSLATALFLTVMYFYNRKLMKNEGHVDAK